MRFDKAYFVGDHPAGYTDYGTLNRSMFEAIADLVEQYDKPLLIAGCGYGYTIEELVDKGVDAYGIDISQFALIQSAQRIRTRVAQADMTDLVEMEAIVNMFTDFETVVTEASMSCVDDPEMASMVLNQIADNVIHLVRTDVNDEFYNVKSLTEWRAMLPSDTWLSYEEVIA